MIRAAVPSLDRVREKVEAAQRLDAAEAEMLWDERIDLHELGELANLVRERKKITNHSIPPLVANPLTIKKRPSARIAIPSIRSRATTAVRRDSEFNCGMSKP